MRQRAVWMDVIRGLAIIAVIYGHAYGVGIQEGLFGPSEGHIVTNQVLVLVRMPLLIFLSGMLVPRSISRGWRHFLPGKFTKLAWPYAVWIALFFVLLWVNDAGSLSDIPMNILYPENPNQTVLWYLRNLFFYYLIAQIIVWMKLPLWSGAAAGFVISIIQVIINPATSTTDLRFASLMTFFFLGAAVMQNLTTISAFCSRRPVAITLLALFALGSLVYTNEVMPVRYRPEFIWVPLAFIALILAFAPRIKSSAWTRPIEFIGRNSLYYYVMHYHLFLIYAWEYGQGMNTGLTSHLLLLMLVGLVIPTSVVHLARLIPPIAWLFFELPWPRKKKPVARI